MTLIRRVLFAAAAAAALTPMAAFADTYTVASFTGAIYPGNANVRAPFSGNGFNQGDLLSGSLVFDNQLIPASGSGFQNVFFNSFPDAAAIPGADSLQITLDGLSLNAGSNIDALLPAGVQYNNGHFNGLEFITDFQFQSNYYQFRVDGSSFSVYALDGDVNAYGDPRGNTTGPRLIGGYINIGDANLTNQAVYDVPVTTTPGVPEPATWAMFLLGFGAIGWTLRSRRSQGGMATTA